METLLLHVFGKLSSFTVSTLYRCALLIDPDYHSRRFSQQLVELMKGHVRVENELMWPEMGRRTARYGCARSTRAGHRDEEYANYYYARLSRKAVDDIAEQVATVLKALELVLGRTGRRQQDNAIGLRIGNGHIPRPADRGIERAADFVGDLVRQGVCEGLGRLSN